MELYKARMILESAGYRMNDSEDKQAFIEYVAELLKWDVEYLMSEYGTAVEYMFDNGVEYPIDAWNIIYEDTNRDKKLFDNKHIKKNLDELDYEIKNS